MPSASQVYGGAFLNASELGQGKRWTAVIHDVAQETVGQESKFVLVLSLVSPQGKPWAKKLVLNKSNTLQLVAALDDDYSHWPGRSIELWAENVMFQGRPVPGVKVLPVLPPAAATPGDGAGPRVNGPVTYPAATAPISPPGKVWAGPGCDIDDEIPF